MISSWTPPVSISSTDTLNEPGLEFMGQSSSPGSEIKNVNFKKKDKKDIIKKKENRLFQVCY